MEKEFDYSQVPGHFVHCFNNACPLADKCLRQLVARCVDASCPVVQAVSPAVWPTVGGACNYFKPIHTIRLAWGFKRILSALPHEQSLSASADLRQMYTRSTLSRLLNGKRGIKPQEQAKIARIFQRYGIEPEAVFDRWTEEYEW